MRIMCVLEDIYLQQVHLMTGIVYISISSGQIIKCGLTCQRCIRSSPVSCHTEGQERSGLFLSDRQRGREFV